MELANEFIKVNTGKNMLYGGSQGELSDKNLCFCGCGVVSALDVLLYLRLYHGCCSEPLNAVHSPELDIKDYDRLALRLCREYFPLIPRLGMNGLTLTAGLNRYFQRYGLSYRASLGTGGADVFAAIDDTLGRDLPLILSVGPNFPAVWGKHRLPLYQKASDGSYLKSCEVKSHYVTVTGTDSERLMISSWGRRYYIDKKEFISYARKHSIELLTTVIRIRKNDTQDRL